MYFCTQIPKAKVMGKIRNNFSISKFFDHLEQSFARFPVTILACLALALVAASAQDGRYILFCVIAVPVSLTVSLFCENRVKQWANMLITLGSVCLWFAYAFLFSVKSESMEQLVQDFAIGVCFVVAIFTILFLKREPDDRRFWNYSHKVFVSSSIALSFALALMIGLYLPIIFIDVVSSANVEHVFFPYIASFCFFFLYPLFTICYFPTKEELQDNSLNFSRLSKIFTQYLLLPLVALYFFILYFYLIYIILSWELPQGMVTYMVTTSMFFYLLVLLFSYPAYIEGESRIFSFVARFGALFALPLVVLMTVGIGYRISQYGLTINRCYVLALNIWFYAVLIFLFVTKARKIKWIPISFAVAFLLVSVGPWSMSSITFRHLSRNIVAVCEKENLFEDGTLVAERLLDYKKKGLPLSDDAGRIEGVTSIFSQYEYIHRHYGEKDAQKIFSRNGRENLAILGQVTGNSYESDTEEKYEYYSLRNTVKEFDITGYQYFAKGHQWCIEGDCVFCVLENGKRLPIKKAVLLNKYKTKSEDLSFKGENFLIVMECANFTMEKKGNRLELVNFSGEFCAFYSTK